MEEHKHEHAHAHIHSADDQREVEALLEYMIKHNSSHTKELSKVEESLKNLGKDNASKLIKEAADEYEKGNELLKKSLEELKG